jgi:hypothetical protein
MRVPRMTGFPSITRGLISILGFIARLHSIVPSGLTYDRLERALQAVGK